MTFISSLNKYSKEQLITEIMKLKSDNRILKDRIKRIYCISSPVYRKDRLDNKEDNDGLGDA
jgi:hypothetical protein